VNDYGEHLVGDVRLARVEERLRLEFVGLPHDAQFLTYVQDKRETKNGILEPQAVFMVMSPNPRYPQFTVMTTGTAALEDWDESEREHRRYVGVPDPLRTLYRPVVREHVTTIQNLREMT
jgi:hypothetical protein